jgi:tripartite-type tricarboxylate transporter receptor subunit TctC
MMIDAPVTVVPQLKAGKVKALALAEKSRLTTAPEVPTVDEAGLPGFYFSNWFGLYAPKGTPQPIVSRLNAAMVAALADATVRARFTELGQDVFPREQQTVEAHTALQKADIEKWWPIIKAAGIKGE